MTNALLLLFPAAMILAACSDFLTMKIPNWLTVVFAALFPVAALLVGLPMQEFGLHLAAGVAMLVLGFAFFAFGWIGGGDAKFFAGTALWLGWGALLPYIFLFSILGGVLTLVILAGRKMPLPVMLGRSDWALRLHDPRGGIPYGIALAAAGLLIFPDSDIFAALIAR